jgi:hypothetical protein
LQLLQVPQLRQLYTTSTSLQLHLQPHLQLQHYNFNNINPTTTTTSTITTAAATTTSTALHHTTPRSCEWGDYCNHCSHSKKTAPTTFAPSMEALCHPGITTTHLSYSVLSLKLLPSPCAVLLVLVFIHLDALAKKYERD